MTNNIQEISSEQFKIILDRVSREFLGKKFKLAENYKEKYDEYIAKMESECEKLKQKGQVCKKEQDFLDNTKKIMDVLGKSTEIVGKEQFGQAITASDHYLYAIMLNLEKLGIIETV